MPKPVRGPRRPPLPKLIAVPIAEPRTLNKRNRQLAAPERDVPPGIFEAGDALTSLVSLVASFIAKDPQYVDVFENLLCLDHAIDDIERAIVEGWFPESPTDSSEGIDELHEIAENLSNFSSELDDPTNPAAVKMMQFWLEEIGRRTIEYTNICTTAVNGNDADKVFEELRTLRYPL